MPFTPTLTPTSTAAEIAEQARAAAQYGMELRARPADQRGDDFATDLRSAIDAIHELDAFHSALNLAEQAQREQARQEAEDRRNRARGGRTTGVDLDGGRRSLGDQVVENEGFEEWATGRRSGPFQVEVRNLLGTWADGDHALASGTDAAIPVGQPAIVPGSMQRRSPYLRSIMSTQTTGLPIVPYYREKNQITNETGAQMVAQGSAKPEVMLEFERYNAIIEKIAAWIPVTEEAMTDAPTLRGYIDTRLDYMLMIREEQQIINGNGTSPQLEGLETVGDTQTQSVVSGDYPATIGLAISKVELVDGDPDGVVTNPNDFWVAQTTRHANQFDNANLGAGGPPNATGGVTWGLTAVRTRAQTSGAAWVGAWRLGSTLFDRQQTTIKVGDQHEDNFVKNILVVLAEKRVGVAWHRPNLFVKATVPTT